MKLPRPPRVLCVVNSQTSGPRRLSDWLEEAGIEVVAMLGETGLPTELSGFDGLVMLGGGLMPDDYVRAPWLYAERQLATESIALDLPTLGICLGAQVLAAVGGGEVRANYGPKERGSTMIHLSEAGLKDPVLGRMGGIAPMIENHEDLITRLPTGAMLLASSEAVENQAFVLGSHVRGVQFHPEVGAAALASWDDAALTGEGYDIRELRAAAEAVDDENYRASRALVDAFAVEVLEWEPASPAPDGARDGCVTQRPSPRRSVHGVPAR